MYTIGQLAKLSGLARTSLLYYDEIGLLKATQRTLAGYRLYNEAAKTRLLHIVDYRKAGLSLQQIEHLLASAPADSAASILRQRLEQINQDIADLRQQQIQVIAMLSERGLSAPARSFNKAQWVELLESVGLNKEGQQRWHQAFEQQMPLAHQDFLEALHLEPDEISAIRAWAQGKS